MYGTVRYCRKTYGINRIYGLFLLEKNLKRSHIYIYNFGRKIKFDSIEQGEVSGLYYGIKR